MKLFNRLSQDIGGQVAVLFALSLVPIVAVAGFAIDFQQTVKRKAKVQLVMDSAVLAAARVKQTGASDAEVKLALQQFMDAQINSLGGLNCGNAAVTISTVSEEIEATMNCKQTTSLMNVVGQDEMPFKIVSGSDYGIDKVDVAFMFDVSGSMNSANRLTNLKAAAKEAIDVLLPAGASPDLIENTRLAMVSYNSMVDAGEFFEGATGVTPTRTYEHELVTTIPGSGDTDEGKLDDDIQLGLYDSRNDSLITYFGDDAEIALTEDQLDHLAISFTVPTDSDYYGKHESAQLRLRGDKSHDQKENGEPYALFGDSGGNLYGESFDFGDYRVRLRLFKKDNQKGGRIYNKWFDFDLIEYTEETTVTELKEYTLTSTCVWERDGIQKFTDGSPVIGAYLAHRQAWFVEDDSRSDGGYWEVGHPNRPNDGKYDGDECRDHEPVELTNNRNTLNNYVNSLTAGGWTAGHLGVAWTWYLVSEEWNTVFDGDAAPLAYSEPDSAKAVILMTDGAFNAEIFPGQGDSDDQARALCDNMKQKDVQIYAVALSAPDAGKAVLSYCATGPDYYFEPDTASELTDAYRKIATSIADLRISK